MAHGGLSPCCHSGALAFASEPGISRLLKKIPGSRFACRGMTAWASHQEHALAVDLFVEQLIGLLGLVELPAMGEQLIDIDAALDREARAFGLDDVRKRPGGDQ